MKTTLLALMIMLSGCNMATKTRELGQSISNIRHPVAIGLGAVLYKTGKNLEYDTEELDTTEQVIKGDDLEVKFEE